MTSLHWMLVLTLALLHFCNSAPRRDTIESKFEIMKEMVKSLKNSNCAESDATFYSPKVNKECIMEALSCSAKELNTVRAECFDKAINEPKQLNYIRRVIEESLSNNKLQAGGENCICEGSEKEDYKKFLDNILTLTERLNSSS